MLSFDIRPLQSKSAQVDDRLPADDPVWQEGDPRPEGAVHVTGRLSTAGSGRFYFSGRFEGTVTGECRRCLDDVRARVADEAHLLFVEADDEQANEPDVYPIDPRAHALDLRPAVREHWVLSAPTYAQCRDDCKGLCPTCGTNLNDGACDCAPAADSRWEALRGLRANPE